MAGGYRTLPNLEQIHDFDVSWPRDFHASGAG